MKRLLTFLIWFPAVVSTLVSCLFLYSYYSYALAPKKILKQTTEKPKYYKMYVSHPETLGESTATVKTKDAIPELVYQYLKKYNSPMVDSAYPFVQVFRQYGIDPIVPLAIAQCESNLGRKMPPDCNNPFGLGIHSRGTLCFDSWEEGYLKMAKVIKESYVKEGLITVDEIMGKYCPLSLEKGGSWAKCVRQFTEEIQTLGNKEN